MTYSQEHVASVLDDVCFPFADTHQLYVSLEHFMLCMFIIPEWHMTYVRVAYMSGHLPQGWEVYIVFPRYLQVYKKPFWSIGD